MTTRCPIDDEPCGCTNPCKVPPASYVRRRRYWPARLAGACFIAVVAVLIVALGGW